MVGDQRFGVGSWDILEFFIGGDGGIIAPRNVSEEGLYLAAKVFELPLKENIFIIRLGELLCLLLCEFGISFTFCQSLSKL